MDQLRLLNKLTNEREPRSYYRGFLVFSLSLVFSPFSLDQTVLDFGIFRL